MNQNLLAAGLNGIGRAELPAIGILRKPGHDINGCVRAGKERRPVVRQRMRRWTPDPLHRVVTPAGDQTPIGLFGGELTLCIIAGGHISTEFRTSHGNDKSRILLLRGLPEKISVEARHGGEIGALFMRAACVPGEPELVELDVASSLRRVTVAATAMNVVAGNPQPPQPAIQSEDESDEESAAGAASERMNDFYKPAGLLAAGVVALMAWVLFRGTFGVVGTAVFMLIAGFLAAIKVVATSYARHGGLRRKPGAILDHRLRRF